MSIFLNGLEPSTRDSEPDSLKKINALLASGASGGIPGTPGSPSSSVITVQGLGYNSEVVITRPSNTNTYGALDAVGDTNGSAIKEFTSIGPSGGHIFITSAWLRIDLDAVPTGMTSFRLHLYSTSPTAIADEATWSLIAGDRSNYKGFIDLGSPADFGASLFCQLDGINKQIQITGTSLFAVLQTIGTYAGASATVYTIRLRSAAI